MGQNAIEWLEVAAVLATTDHAKEGKTFIRYDGSIGERVFEVFVARDSDPMLVVTLIER